MISLSKTSFNRLNVPRVPALSVVSLKSAPSKSTFSRRLMTALQASWSRVATSLPSSRSCAGG